MYTVYLDWNQMKEDIIRKSFPLNYKTIVGGYEMFVVDRQILWACSLTNPEEVADFEANYKSKCNKSIYDEYGRQYDRGEVRPIDKSGYFTSIGDDPVLGIGKGARIDWNFAKDPEKDIYVDSNRKRRIIDIQFNESVNIRAGFLCFMNAKDECLIDMGIVCPAGEWYISNSGVPKQATEDTWVNIYVRGFDMDGDCPNGIYIDSGTASQDVPTNYKLRFQITTETDDFQSRGHVGIFVYRKHSVDLP